MYVFQIIHSIIDLLISYACFVHILSVFTQKVVISALPVRNQLNQNYEEAHLFQAHINEFNCCPLF